MLTDAVAVAIGANNRDSSELFLSVSMLCRIIVYVCKLFAFLLQNSYSVIIVTLLSTAVHRG